MELHELRSSLINNESLKMGTSIVTKLKLSAFMLTAIYENKDLNNFKTFQISLAYNGSDCHARETVGNAVKGEVSFKTHVSLVLAEADRMPEKGKRLVCCSSFILYFKSRFQANFANVAYSS